MKDHLVLQILLDGIHQSKTRLELHKAIEDKDINIANTLRFATSQSCCDPYKGLGKREAENFLK